MAHLPDPAPQTPPDVASAEEAGLIWRWLERTNARIVDSSGPLSLPVHQVIEIDRLDAA